METSAAAGASPAPPLRAEGPVHSVSKPSFCVIAQGSKEIFLGDSRYQYDPFHYLLATIELPSVSHVLEASQSDPISVSAWNSRPRRRLGHGRDRSHLASAAMLMSRAIDCQPAGRQLLDAIVRLARLLDSPAEAPILMPLITREIIYRLLLRRAGSSAPSLRMLGGYTPDIARAVERLRQDFDQPLRIEQIARELGMSVSGFPPPLQGRHRHEFAAIPEAAAACRRPVV